jgi:hypothetical protein
MRSTYTYALLDVSAAAYREIREKLEAAGYQHALHEDDGVIVLDMHGVALRQEPPSNLGIRKRTGARP